jgi:hypothetical protein
MRHGSLRRSVGPPPSPTRIADFTATPSANIPTRSSTTRLDGGVEARGVVGLDADDPGARLEGLHVRGDVRDEPAAADRDEDRVDGAAVLAQDLHAYGPQPRDDFWIVVGGDERQVALRSEAQGLDVRLVETCRP